MTAEQFKSIVERVDIARKFADVANEPMSAEWQIVDKLIAYVRELEKDKERLDWLQDHIKIRHTISISHYSDVGYRCSMSLQITCGIDAMASSVRQVIDNAKEGK